MYTEFAAYDHRRQMRKAGMYHRVSPQSIGIVDPCYHCPKADVPEVSEPGSETLKQSSTCRVSRWDQGACSRPPSSKFLHSCTTDHLERHAFFPLAGLPACREGREAESRGFLANCSLDGLPYYFSTDHSLSTVGRDDVLLPRRARANSRRDNLGTSKKDDCYG